MKTVVVTPTYNERENIAKLVSRILGLGMSLDILVVDDNSPDGTGDVADRLAKQHREVSVLHRSRKEGLGKAYVAGFSRALDEGYEAVITMDADCSHDPRYLPRMREALETHEVAVGTRYMKGGGVENWPFYRRILSRGGSIYVRSVTKMPLRDPTGGFNAYRREVLEEIRPESVRSTGYAFMIELKFRCWEEGFRIAEVPIVFVARSRGSSKMSGGIILEALLVTWRLRAGRIV